MARPVTFSAVVLEAAPVEPDQTTGSARFGRTYSVWSGLRAPIIAAVLGAISWVLALRLEFNPISPLTAPSLRSVALLGIGLVVLVRLASGTRFDALLADVSAALVGVFCSFSVAVALHGTPWSLYGLDGDQMFRTEQITHFAATWRLDDFAYRGLPGFYPPLFPWLLGRAADLTGVEAWRTVRPFQIVMTLVIPVAAYLIWRRLVTPWLAVGVTAVVSLLLANPVKVDEWLVLLIIVPWWFDAFRDVRRAGARRWPSWAHGVIAGLLLLTYTYYFLPLALATVVGLVVDWRRGRPLRPALVRFGWIVGIGLAVSAVYWVPTALYFLRGHPFYNTQFRWNTQSLSVLPSPIRFTFAGAVMVAGLVYMALRAHRDRVAESLAVLTGSVYLYFAIGFCLAVLDRPILVFHAEVLLLYGMTAAGALAAGAAASWLRKVSVTPALAILLSAAVLFTATDTYLGSVTGTPAVAAHNTRLPGGGYGRYSSSPHGIFEVPVGGASAQQLHDIVLKGHPRSWRPVLLSARTDILGLYPTYAFLHWAAIYSNGFAQYHDRVDFITELSREQDPATFARLARENQFDPIDAFVLAVNGERLEFTYRLDNFPYAFDNHTVTFARSQFDPQEFTITETGGYFVAAYR